MTLQEKALLTLNKIQDYSKDAAGDFAKTQDGAANSAKIFQESLKELGTTFGQELLPEITPIIRSATELIRGFSELDKETRQQIIRFALYAAALGPVVSVVGKLTTGVGSLVGVSGKVAGGFKVSQKAITELGEAAVVAGASTETLGTGVGTLNSAILPVAVGVAALGGALYTIKESQDLYQSSILKTTEEMSGMEKVIANLTGVKKKSKDELIDMGLVYKDFNSKVSPEFQKRVKDNEKTLRDFGLYLTEISFDNVLSEEEINGFDERVNEMVEKAISTMESRKEESNESLKGLFLNDAVISESEQATLDFLSRSFDVQITETNKIKDEINAIKALAIQEGRALNEEEIKAVEEKLATIKKLELEALGGNAEEIAYAKNEFNARMASIDLQNATDLLEDKAKLRDDEIVKISASYDSEIDLLRGKMSTATKEEKVFLRESIENLKKDKADKIGIQNDLWEEYLKILGEKNPQILAEINKYNGQQLTELDKKNQANLDKTIQNYYELNKVTETGMYNMYNKVTKSYDEMYVNVDKNTGQIIGVWNKTQNTVSGYTEKISQDTVKMGSEYAKTAKGINDNPIYMKVNTANAKDEIDGINYRLDSMNGKTITTYIGVQSFVAGGGMTMEAMEDGGYVSSDKIAYTNEKHAGFELIDGNARIIGEDSFGAITALSAGARVYNNATSVDMMRAEIANQLNNVDIGRYNGASSIGAKTLSSNARNINDNSGVEALLKGMIALLGDIKNKDTNLYIDSKTVARTTAKAMNRELGFQGRKGW